MSAADEERKRDEAYRRMVDEMVERLRQQHTGAFGKAYWYSPGYQREVTVYLLYASRGDIDVRELHLDGKETAEQGEALRAGGYENIRVAQTALQTGARTIYRDLATLAREAEWPDPSFVHAQGGQPARKYPLQSGEGRFTPRPLIALREIVVPCPSPHQGR